MAKISHRLRDTAGWFERRHYKSGEVAMEAADLLDKAEAALAECEAELNAYYANEYAGDHPYSVKKLAQAKATNPASETLAAIRSEGNGA